MNILYESTCLYSIHVQQYVYNNVLYIQQYVQYIIENHNDTKYYCDFL